ncbi:MAG: FMN-binding protein [Acidimicrobiales bacterium]
MRRFPFVIGATAAGLAGVLSFHSSSAHPLGSAAIGVKSSGGAKPGGHGTSSSTSPTTTPTTRPATTSGSTAPHSSTTSTTAVSSGPATVTGTAEQYGYGILSVRVAVANARISAVQVARLQTADSYSQQIANQVIPYLKREVLTAQSARINGISGATYTSEAYALSVQSALNRLHFK